FLLCTSTNRWHNSYTYFSILQKRLIPTINEGKHPLSMDTELKYSWEAFEQPEKLFLHKPFRVLCIPTIARELFSVMVMECYSNYYIPTMVEE
ncbi:hypothetical protein FRX31_016878, partial [Thalictrum thalictroides]